MGYAREGIFGRGIALVAGTASLISGGLGAAILLVPVLGSQNELSILLGFGALVLLILSAGAGIMAGRFWRNPLPPRSVVIEAEEHQRLRDDFDSDVLASDRWPSDCPGVHWWRTAADSLLKQPETHLETLQTLCTQFPESLRFSQALAVVLTHLGRHTEARDEILRISDAHLREGTRAFLWIHWLHQIKNSQAPSVFEETVEEVLRNAPRSTHAAILDFASCQFFLGVTEGRRLDLADRFSLRALEMAPDSPTIRGTRGSVLVELNRLDEAAHLLEPVLDASEPGINRTYSALYLAILANRTGNRSRARRLARIARTSRNPFVFRRLKTEGL